MIETKSNMQTSPVVLVFILMLYVLPYSHSKSTVTHLPGFSGDLPFTLETGYVGVGKGDEAEMFYYFVESQRNPQQDPLLLYLTGGPGTSAILPFFYQIGNCFHLNILILH
ncbi:putative peptidase S10, serine carboxypeptidase, alpha/Beta hydrolase [Helianthus annuus]|nr:putative peptidase S10, serine carboxypeptidase, alpha/Beta hydrolase [Helianthus annuus]